MQLLERLDELVKEEDYVGVPEFGQSSSSLLLASADTGPTISQTSQRSVKRFRCSGHSRVVSQDRTRMRDAIMGRRQCSGRLLADLFFCVLYNLHSALDAPGARSIQPWSLYASDAKPTWLLPMSKLA